ncbi:hypothetical protein GQX73_g10501 [Xylaria multiplex]|uniref:2EXR domain-containing protein n=1 Tax=Xylaria multiplex TaxID=323545 RepID=A0A7C8MME9_9PEZI|nr:hypothetical protein GQX73_g10501 [Xylaria multiplex]
MESTKQKEKLDEFHLFPTLPVELQLMIWEFSRINQNPIHHYLFIKRDEVRFYAAIDVEDGIVGISRPTSHAVIDDDMQLNHLGDKIRLTGNVRTAVRRLAYPYEVRLWGIDETIFTPDPEPAYTWVDFDKDVFILGSFGKPIEWYFRHCAWVFAPIIIREEGLVIGSDHWAHRIQQLGVYVYEKAIGLGDIDCGILSKLRKLRKVFLIASTTGLCGYFFHYVSLKWGTRLGLLPLDEVIEGLPPGVELAYVKDILTENRHLFETYRAKILRLFEDGDRECIDVEFVIDTSPQSPRRHMDGH